MSLCQKSWAKQLLGAARKVPSLEVQLGVCLIDLCCKNKR